MCVATVGKVISLNDKYASVDIKGTLVDARTGLVDVNIGDIVLIHAGCILQKLSSEDARLMNEI